MGLRRLRNLRLTCGAVVRAPATKLDLDDRRATHRTGLIAPSMNRWKPIAGEGLASPDGSPALFDPAVKRPTDRLVQPGDLVRLQTVRRSARMDAGAVQRLIDVDIAQTRHHSLVEQRLLDRDPAALQASGEVVASELGGAGSLGSKSECPERVLDGIGRHQTPPAELPDVAVVSDGLPEAQREVSRLVRKRSLRIGHRVAR